MKGVIAPVHRKALLNALKTAATLDPDRLDELLLAAKKSFVALGWDAGEDLWTLGPLLEIAGRMARHEDAVDQKLPALAQTLAQRQIVSPEQFGVDLDPENSITLSLLSMSARIDRLVQRESFGFTPEDARDWILDITLQSAAHLYAELERQDAAASERTDVGAEGKHMVLQAALRESLNLLEPLWWQAAARLEEHRARGSLAELRSWLETSPEDVELTRITAEMGEGMDTLIAHLQSVRERVSQLRNRLSQRGTLDEEETPQQNGGSGRAPEAELSITRGTTAQSPATPPVTEKTAAPIPERGVIVRKRFGQRR